MNTLTITFDSPTTNDINENYINDIKDYLSSIGCSNSVTDIERTFVDDGEIWTIKNNWSKKFAQELYNNHLMFLLDGWCICNSSEECKCSNCIEHIYYNNEQLFYSTS